MPKTIVEDQEDLRIDKTQQFLEKKWKKILQKDEDKKILSLVKQHGEGNWTKIKAILNTDKTSKQIRERYLNILKTNINKTKFSLSEDNYILEKLEEIGTKWKVISLGLKNRTENQIKNHFHSHIKKKFFTTKQQWQTDYPKTYSLIVNSKIPIIINSQEISKPSLAEQMDDAANSERETISLDDQDDQQLYTSNTLIHSYGILQQIQQQQANSSQITQKIAQQQQLALNENNNMNKPNNIGLQQYLQQSIPNFIKQYSNLYNLQQNQQQVNAPAQQTITNEDIQKVILTQQLIYQQQQQQLLQQQQQLFQQQQQQQFFVSTVPSIYQQPSKQNSTFTFLQLQQELNKSIQQQIELKKLAELATVQLQESIQNKKMTAIITKKEQNE